MLDEEWERYNDQENDKENNCRWLRVNNILFVKYDKGEAYRESDKLYFGTI